MKEYKALIVEDEPKCSGLLALLINKYCPFVQVVAISEDLNNAVNCLNLHEPDIVFLDLHLNGDNGFSLFHKLSTEFHLKVIVTTAHQQHAIQALRLGVTDYLLKPVSPEELKAAVQKAVRQIEGSKALLSTSKQKKSLPKLILAHQNGYEIIAIKDIVYCQAHRNYTKIYLIGGQQILTTKTLAYYEKALSKHLFFRINRSEFINMLHVSKIDKGKHLGVTLTGNHFLAVSKGKKESFLNYFIQL